MCEPQPEQWANGTVCASCVYVGLLPGCGTIWSGVRICDKLQIYLGDAHWCIPLPLRQNAQCWLGCQMLTRVAGSGKIKRHGAQNHQQKDFCFLPHLLLRWPSMTWSAVSGSVVLTTLQKQLSVLSRQSQTSELLYISHLWTKWSHWLAQHSCHLELKSHQGDTDPALKAAFYPPSPSLLLWICRPSTFNRPAATKVLPHNRLVRS